ncbi:hypothetical protein C2E23DRAFT_822396 [Lenzites betulinus]|nr:hypothetical protein C2E23DRAFT_822396 [Lenzites betulinus]
METRLLQWADGAGVAASCGRATSCRESERTELGGFVVFARVPRSNRAAVSPSCIFAGERRTASIEQRAANSAQRAEQQPSIPFRPSTDSEMPLDAMRACREASQSRRRCPHMPCQEPDASWRPGVLVSLCPAWPIATIARMESGWHRARAVQYTQPAHRCTWPTAHHTARADRHTIPRRRRRWDGQAGAAPCRCEPESAPALGVDPRSPSIRIHIHIHIHIHTGGSTPCA